MPQGSGQNTQDGQACCNLIPREGKALITFHPSFGPLLFPSRLFGITGGPLRAAQRGPRSSNVFNLIINDDELGANDRIHPGAGMLIADNLTPTEDGGNLPGLRGSGSEVLSARQSARHHI